MADDSLNQPVIVRAVSLNASSIPAGFSPAFSQYILSQSLDFTNVAGKANEAGQGAYEAQIKNEEQDVTLASHDARITANTSAISLVEVRVSTAEGKIITLRSDVDFLLDEVVSIEAQLVTLDGRLDTAESSIGNLQSDYVSKSVTSSQSLSSPLNVSTSYSVGGTKVIGARQSGWTAATGVANMGAFNANTPYTTGATYSQAEAQAIAGGLIQVRQRLKALEDMARTHGLIN